MNDRINIFQFLSSRQIDYLSCPINKLLHLVEQYCQIIDEPSFFSAQMLLFSQSIEENRSGIEAIRISMKALEMVSPPVYDNSSGANARSDNDSGE